MPPEKDRHSGTEMMKRLELVPQLQQRAEIFEFYKEVLEKNALSSFNKPTIFVEGKDVRKVHEYRLIGKKFPKDDFKRLRDAYNAQEKNKQKTTPSRATAAAATAEEFGQRQRSAARASRDQQKDRVRNEQAEEEALAAAFDPNLQDGPVSLADAAAQSLELDDENKIEVEYEDYNDGAGAATAAGPIDVFEEPAPKSAAQMEAEAKERRAKTDRMTANISRAHEERERARNHDR